MAWTRRLFRFPNPVNEVAARAVAGGVLLMALGALVFSMPWLLIALLYGFCARVAAGPTLSPLGQLATRVIVPVLPFAERPVPGPPKRFAQAIGAFVCTVALLCWVTVGWDVAEGFVALLAVAAFLESAFGLCVGCKVFAGLMNLGVIPEQVCLECAQVSRRHREPAAPAE